MTNYSAGIVAASGIKNKILLDILTDLSLLTNLQVCLDAGDSSSYSSGQSWLDRSGNGQDFFRGATVGAEASDPTFNGVAGALNANNFWSLDGGDYFRYDSANAAWMENVHKDNALFSAIAWIYLPSFATTRPICGTSGTGATTGFTWSINVAAHHLFRVENAGAQVINQASAAATLAINTWTFCGISLDEVSNVCIMRIDENEDTVGGTYTSPSAGAATHTMEICADGGGNLPWPAGSRIAEFAAWNGALSSANLIDIYNATRTRFNV